MPVTVVGMHRSGTSMVSALLHHAGLYFGPEDELMPATPDNQEGFWENLRFVEVNEEILGALGAGWDEPPARFVVNGPTLAAPRVKAETLAADFELHQPWAWKDPRTTLLLPLWLDLVPNLRVVGCVRNPLEVALSLHRRNFLSYERGISLWLDYNQRLLEAVPPEQLLLTHYETYFAAPAVELRRVLAHCGVQAPDWKVEKACAAARCGLRHNRFGVADLLVAEVSAEVLELYGRLCRGSGWSENGAVTQLSTVQLTDMHERGPRGKLNRAVVDAHVVGGEVEWLEERARIDEWAPAQEEDLEAAGNEVSRGLG
jgi:hypothetical protein